MDKVKKEEDDDEDEETAERKHLLPIISEEIERMDPREAKALDLEQINLCNPISPKTEKRLHESFYGNPLFNRGSFVLQISTDSKRLVVNGGETRESVFDILRKNRYTFSTSFPGIKREF